LWYQAVAAGAVDVCGEIEDLREQNDAVQIDALAVFQDAGQNRRARGAVALSEDVFGRVPPVVLGDETLNEAREGVGVFIHAPEGLLRVLAGQPSEACAGHIDKHQIAGVEQRVGVFHQCVGCRGQVLVAARDHVLGAKRTHVQPDRRAARPAVVEEHYGALFGLSVLLEVCDVKHACNGSRVFRLLGAVEGELAAGLRLAVQPQLRILRVGRAYNQRPRDGSIGDLLAAHIDRTLGGDVGRRSLLGGFFAALVRCLVGRFVVIGPDESRREEKRRRNDGGGDVW